MRESHLLNRDIEGPPQVAQKLLNEELEKL